MPADPITNPLAAAWDNTAPGAATNADAAAFSNNPPASAANAARVSCIARATSNVASFSICPSTFDGVSMQGTGSTSNLRRVLLHQQTNNVQNGIYVAAPNGNTVSVTGNFTAGVYTKTGLTVGRLYYFLLNTAGNSISNGTITLTESGYIAPNGSGALTIYGTGGNAQLNFLVEASLERALEFNEPNEFPTDLLVRVEAGTPAASYPDWWRLTAPVPVIGTSPVIFEEITIGGLSADTFGMGAFSNTPPETKTFTV
jgi:hypothetical protein